MDLFRSEGSREMKKETQKKERNEGDGKMSNESHETIADIVSEMWEAEIARLKAALVASNDELELARSNSRAMYNRLNAENIRISEMYRETIQVLRAENTRLRAALKPVLDIVMDMRTSDLSMEMAITEAKRIYKEGRDELKEEAK